MRIFFVITVCFLMVGGSSAQPFSTKDKLVNQVSSITAKPSFYKANMLLYIMHPMIKKEDRKREYVLNGDLSWKGDLCEISYNSYKQTQGPESKSTVELGKTMAFQYPLNTLKKLLTDNDFSEWKAAKGMSLDEQVFNGYESSISLDGEKRDIKVYVKDNELYAVSCGFDSAKLTHEENMQESADIWYFAKQNGQICFVKKLTIEALKQNSVPVIKKTTSTFQ